ncbi:hypothetical protein EXIGLDRAFT_769344 [Exidia glandulosa HHB12029]|uniref:Uncharacterized protein n=1 Tax=Exidia glandulosa HHB12029 TaxID=1314781 RepID=A0A165HJB5_EXIGL|nr:hypothetical protein EXIGLDRAFT_769344 [Exidia glandulosa HHB12029]
MPLDLFPHDPRPRTPPSPLPPLTPTPSTTNPRTSCDVSAVAPARTDLCTGAIGLEARTDLCTSGPFGSTRSSVAASPSPVLSRNLIKSPQLMPRLAAHPSRRLPPHALRSLAVRREVMACTAASTSDVHSRQICSYRRRVNGRLRNERQQSLRSTSVPGGERKSRRTVDISERLPEVSGTDQEPRRMVAFRDSLRTIGVESHALAIASGLPFAADLEHPDVTDTVWVLKDLPFEVLVASIPDIDFTMRPIHVISSASLRAPGAFISITPSTSRRGYEHCGLRPARRRR